MYTNVVLYYTDCNRSKFTKINQILDLLSVVYHEEVLSALCFSLYYINDLAEVSDTLNTISFACDTTVTIEGKKRSRTY